jgi:pyruvate,water dikinase
MIAALTDILPRQSRIGVLTKREGMVRLIFRGIENQNTLSPALFGVLADGPEDNPQRISISKEEILWVTTRDISGFPVLSKNWGDYFRVLASQAPDEAMRARLFRVFLQLQAIYPQRAYPGTLTRTQALAAYIALLKKMNPENSPGLVLEWLESVFRLCQVNLSIPSLKESKPALRLVNKNHLRFNPYAGSLSADATLNPAVLRNLGQITENETEQRALSEAAALLQRSFIRTSRQVQEFTRQWEDIARLPNSELVRRQFIRIAPFQLEAAELEDLNRLLNNLFMNDLPFADYTITRFLPLVLGAPYRELVLEQLINLTESMRRRRVDQEGVRKLVLNLLESPVALRVLMEANEKDFFTPNSTGQISKEKLLVAASLKMADPTRGAFLPEIYSQLPRQRFMEWEGFKLPLDRRLWEQLAGPEHSLTPVLFPAGDILVEATHVWDINAYRMVRSLIRIYTQLLEDNDAALQWLAFIRQQSVINHHDLERLVDVVDQMFANYEQLVVALPAKQQDVFGLPELQGIWARLQDTLQNLSETEMQTEASRKLIFELLPWQRPSDVTTLHQMINYLHQNSFRPLLENARRTKATSTWFAGEQRIEVVDGGERAAYFNSRIVSAIMLELVQNLNPSYQHTLNARVVIADDLLIMDLPLGDHSAVLIFQDRPPSEGGLLRVSYFEPDDEEGFSKRLSMIQKILLAYGYHAEMQPGTRLLNVSVDEEHGAHTRQDLLVAFGRMIRLLATLKSINNFFMRHRDLDAQVVTAKYLEDTKLNLKELMAMPRVYTLPVQRLSMEAQAKISSFFQNFLLVPESQERWSAKDLEERIFKPIQEKLNRGELVYQNDQLTVNPRFHPVLDFLEKIIDESATEQMIQMAEMLNLVVERIDFHTVGAIGTFLVKLGRFTDSDGETMLIQAVADPASQLLILARVIALPELKDQTPGVAAPAAMGLEKIRKDLNFFGIISEREIPWDTTITREDIGMVRKRLQQPWLEEESPGVAVFQGISASRGGQIRGNLTFKKAPPAVAGQNILFAPHLSPDDIARCEGYLAVITNGAALSHPIITAREMGLPVIIINANANYRVPSLITIRPEGWNRYGAYRYATLVRQSIHTLGEDQPVVLDAETGRIFIETIPGALDPYRQKLNQRSIPAITQQRTEPAAMATSVPKAQRQIVPLDEINIADPGSVIAYGPKAVNLARLCRWSSEGNYLTPPGIAISSGWFQVFLERTGLGESMSRWMNSLHDPEVLDTMVRAFQNSAQSAKTSLQDLRRSLDTHLRSFSGYYSVRSSAIQEDSEAQSMAGTGTTELMLTPLQIYPAILSNFANAANPRLLTRLAQLGLNQLAHAVVVQAMVESPSAAGVMFTADPVNGNQEQILIEASYGLGPLVVENHVAPDASVVDKNSGREIRFELGTKEVQLAWHGEHLGIEVIPGKFRKQRALSREQVAELARIGRFLEDKAGESLDIEWALKEGRFYILQMRPIASLRNLSNPSAFASRGLQQGGTTQFSLVVGLYFANWFHQAGLWPWSWGLIGLGLLLAQAWTFRLHALDWRGILRSTLGFPRDGDPDREQTLPQKRSAASSA